MTTSQNAVSNWLPRRFLVRSADSGRDLFRQQFGGTTFLLVRLSSYTEPLAVGLAATCPLDAPGMDSAQVATLLTAGVETAQTSFSRAETASGGAQDWIATPLSLEPRFVVPVRKRVREEPQFVTVGRSYRCDIVLREDSISKSHAHFEMRAGNQIWLEDRVSKNHTRVNGAVLESGQIVGPGDVIKFGRVETMLCSASALYQRLIGHA